MSKGSRKHSAQQRIAAAITNTESDLGDNLYELADAADEDFGEEEENDEDEQPAPKAKKARKARKPVEASDDDESEEGDDEEREIPPSRRAENRKHRKTIRQYLQAAIFATADDLDNDDDGKALKAWAIARVEALEEALEEALSFRTDGRPIVLRAA